jgi:hypothetical protein
MNAYEVEEGIYILTNACCYRDKCRQQADRIAELEKQLQDQAMDEVVKIGQEIDAMPQKPLTDKEIKTIIIEHIQTWNSLDNIIAFVRAIEERHGIK